MTGGITESNWMSYFFSFLFLSRNTFYVSRAENMLNCFDFSDIIYSILVKNVPNHGKLINVPVQRNDMMLDWDVRVKN